jgi:hypothetical protein
MKKLGIGDTARRGNFTITTKTNPYSKIISFFANHKCKDNMDYEIVETFDISDDKDKNVLQDCNICQKGAKAQEEYPKMSRLVRYCYEEHQ